MLRDACVQSRQRGLHAQILHVHISAQAHVVSKIPSNMVRIVVDDNLIRVPEPVAAEGEIGFRDHPVPSVEPESAWPTAGNTPDMRRTEASAEVAVFPGMIEMVVRIVRPGVMTDPRLAVIHVRDIGVAGLVGVVAILRWWI